MFNHSSQQQNQIYPYNAQNNAYNGYNQYLPYSNQNNLPMSYGQTNNVTKNYQQNLPQVYPNQYNNYQQSNINGYGYQPAVNPNFCNNPQVMSYAKGGLIKEYAKKIQAKGRNGDVILAHINPQEAAFLKRMGGSGAINPKTGLREYGGFGKFIKKAARVIVPAIASYFGGPSAAIAASAVLGASERGKGNKLKGALQGAGRGAIYAAAAPMVGNMAGVNPAGFMGRMAGMNSPSFLSQLGMAGAPSAGGGIGFWGNGAGNVGAISNYMNGGMGAVINGMPLASGSSSSALVPAAAAAPSSAPGFGGLLQNGLLATAIGGTLLRRERPEKQESLSEYLSNNKLSDDPRYKAGETKRIRRILVAPAAGYDPGVDPEHIYYQEQAYKDGGYLDGDSNGQSDLVPAYLGDEPVRLSHAEFITKAPAVAIAGGGNSNAGGKVFQSLQNEIMKLGAKHGGHLPKGKNLQVMLGEIMIKEGKKRAVRN